jgi:hypothetical protein
VMEGSEVEHEDGRKCIFRNGQWLWDGVKGATYKVCEYDDHPGGDRGEFGMPGLGQARAMIDADDRRIEAGTEPWQASPDKIIQLPRITEHPTMCIKNGEWVVDYGEQGYSMPIPTKDAEYILTILPDILQQFLEKNSKYAVVEQGYDLGDAGIIPDLNRKLGILVARLWNKQHEQGSHEDTDEVIGDMIGHLLLMLAKRRST